MKLGVARALKSIDAKYDEQIIMDGLINYCEGNFTNVQLEAKADDRYPVVSAASIYAKVARDNFMTSLGAGYIKYDFDKHVGYGTKLHMEKMKTYGVSDIHHLSFEPVKKFANL